MHDKSELRRELAARRALAFETQPDARANLVPHFPAAIEITSSTIIAAYMPFRTEIDPLPLLRALIARGGQGAMPRIESPSPLWGGVGVGGGRAGALLNRSASVNTPPSPDPVPTEGGRGGVSPQDRARRLRASSTKYEQRLWDLLRAKRPDQTHWRRQVAIGGYVFDFGCHGLGLLVEVDGGIHKLPAVQARDALKEEVAIEHGYRLIRLQNEDVMKIETAQYFDQFAKLESPSPSWGGVGVGGGRAGAFLERSASVKPPPSPDPFPTEGGRGEALTFNLCHPDDISQFISNKWGLLEPRPDLPEITPTILLVPLLGFDRQGNRIGYGKGYYDTAIAALRASTNITAIGLAFAEQEIDQIPTQPHDQRLDWIVTQNGAYRFPS